MTPPTVAQRYVDAVNSGRLGPIEDLFAEDVVFRTANVYLDGIEELTRYYLEIVFLGEAVLHLVEEFPSPRGHVARIDVRSPLAPNLPPLEIMAHFEVDDDGRVSRFDSFHRLDPSVDTRAIAALVEPLTAEGVANGSEA